MTAGTEPLEALRRGDLAGATLLRMPGLAAFPREILGLGETLEVLDLSGGTLDALPNDLGRLKRLRVLFCSGNRFARLPPVLGDCPALSQVGFRATGLSEVPAESLPENLRWLTLTDNAVAALPEALGRRPRLQKLMLAGNRLDHLPESLADAGSLELLRVSANRLHRLPPWLFALPRLAWLAYAGNAAEPAPRHAFNSAVIPWAELEPGALLGEGASGRIHAARWRAGSAERAVALKLFKGAITSDGLPDHEMEACLAAGDHPSLVGALGRIVDHPEGAAGLVMPLLPPGWGALAGPPSLETCTRDVFPADLTLTPGAVLRCALDVAEGAAWLHGRGLLHGDLYGHNVLRDPATGAAVLSDLGAASRLLPGGDGDALRRIEVRAWGILASELIARCEGPERLPTDFGTLAQACLQADVMARPSLKDILAEIGGRRHRGGRS